MCYGYNTQQVQKFIKEQLPEADGDLNGFDRPKAPIITQADRRVIYAQWWLLPAWYEQESYELNLLNARAETIFEKPAFRNCIKTKRCLVPASHYYEHQWRDPKGKVKHKFKLGVKEQPGFFMAGIYDVWNTNDGGELQSFSIITCEANSLAAEVHNSKKRMPVVLSFEDARNWLDPKLGETGINSLLRPFPSEGMWAEDLDATQDLFNM